jgi:hypothetical protein
VVGDTGDGIGLGVDCAVAMGDAVGDTRDGIGFGVSKVVQGDMSHFFPSGHCPGPGTASQSLHSGVIGLVESSWLLSALS